MKKFLRKNLIWILLLITLFIISLLIKNNYADKILNFDLKINDIILKIRNKNYTAFFKYITHFGGAIFYAFIVIASALFFKPRKNSLYITFSVCFVYLTKYFSLNIVSGQFCD